MSQTESNRRLPRSVYVVHGPNGPCYVGSTMKTMAARWKAHCALVNSKYVVPAFIHFVRQHGRDAFRMEHVACAPDFPSGLEMEKAVIAQLNADGAHLLNTLGMPSEVSRPRIRASRAEKHAAHMASEWAIEHCCCDDHVALRKRRQRHTAQRAA